MTSDELRRRDALPVAPHRDKSVQKLGFTRWFGEVGRETGLLHSGGVASDADGTKQHQHGVLQLCVGLDRAGELLAIYGGHLPVKNRDLVRVADGLRSTQ